MIETWHTRAGRERRTGKYLKYNACKEFKVNEINLKIIKEL